MYRKWFLIGFTLAFGSSQARAADPRIEALAPFLDADVAVVGRIDLEKFDIEKTAARLVEDKTLAEMLASTLAPWLSGLKQAGARDVYLLAGLTSLPPTGTSIPSVVVPLGPGADGAAIGKVLCRGGDVRGPLAWPACTTAHDAVFAGSHEAVSALPQLKPIARPELAEALAAASESSAMLVVIPSADARRVLAEMLPNLPAELGGGPVTVLTKGIRWGVFGVSDRPESGFRFVLQAADASAAKTIAEIGKKADQMLRTSPAVARFVPDFGKLSDRFAAETGGDRITVTADSQAAGAWASSMLKSARQGATRAQCVNNLKQIGLAMHNYLSDHKAFPPAFSADKAGKPLLSWRVLILPYVEQQALYNEFHLDEPWDSPHNKTLIEKMPALYSCPSDLAPKPGAGKTTYLTPRGERTIFPGAVGVKLKEVVDGTSNTILTIDVPADKAVPWTKPDDWDVPEAIDPKTLVTRHPNGTNFGFADGSVKFLHETIAPATLKALFTRNGGEIVSNEAF